MSLPRYVPDVLRSTAYARRGGDPAALHAGLADGPSASAGPEISWTVRPGNGGA